MTARLFDTSFSLTTPQWNPVRFEEHGEQSRPDTVSAVRGRDGDVHEAPRVAGAIELAVATDIPSDIVRTSAVYGFVDYAALWFRGDDRTGPSEQRCPERDECDVDVGVGVDVLRVDQPTLVDGVVDGEAANAHRVRN